MKTCKINILLASAAFLLLLFVSCSATKSVCPDGGCGFRIEDFQSDEVMITGTLDSLLKLFGLRPEQFEEEYYRYIYVDNGKFEDNNVVVKYDNEQCHERKLTYYCYSGRRKGLKFRYDISNDSVRLSYMDFMVEPRLTIVYKGVRLNDKMTRRKFKRVFGIKDSDFQPRRFARIELGEKGWMFASGDYDETKFPWWSDMCYFVFGRNSHLRRFEYNK